MGVGGGSSAKVKSVVYALSPYQQQTMPGLWKDFTSKIYKRTLGDWVSISLVAVPVIGTYFYFSYGTTLNHGYLIISNEYH
ncbi:hypothetical protein DCAR_0521265 [Daucus carota subsp. sativus]|uniref:Cytochrome b-c1 complex subunit 8 n=1 Tax=Daucus carota subsp. sativus TaxID=79200 RepID=A0AAF1B0C5_DAUCS|nr:hypothetical protein DCAR_0521265 [Daucus carota subsp. sativus]